MTENDPFLKDMNPLREGDIGANQRDQSRGSLKDYSLKHAVSVRWDRNKDATRERMVELTIDNLTVIVDSEELLRYLRWV